MAMRQVQTARRLCTVCQSWARTVPGTRRPSILSVSHDACVGRRGATLPQAHAFTFATRAGRYEEGSGIHGWRARDDRGGHPNNRQRHNRVLSRSKASQAKAKRAPPSVPPQFPTKGENGREIMTRSKMEVDAAVARVGLTDKNAREIMRKVKNKMLFKQQPSHQAMGPNHGPTFFSTIHSTFESGVLAVVPDNASVSEQDGTVELCNTGAARTKKEASMLAAVDFLVQLGECSVDIRDPPDVERMRGAEPLPTRGKNGREIMTRSKMQIDAAVASLGLTDRNAREIMHKVKHKMLFKQQPSHQAMGPNHGPTFFSTLHTTFESGVLPLVHDDASVSEQDGTVELCNTGAARTKKEASMLAAVDFLVQLGECCIDIHAPPDIESTRRAEQQQRFKRGVRDAQMILELLGTSRPKLDTEAFGKNEFVTKMRVFLDGGKRLSVVGPPGKSKAEAQGLATIAAVVGGPLEELVGKNRLNGYAKLIESSPAEHVAPLTVHSLPEEARDMLEEALGSPEDHEERMENMVAMQTAFEEKFLRRMEASWQSKLQLEQASFEKRALNESTRSRLQEMMETEEKERSERALSDPEGEHGVMNAIRDSLPIKVIREDLLRALATDQVVVISGGTGSGKSTQCPQYILEDAIAQGKGAETRIIVTQPRRIAASSVAERVANERGEDVGNSVGYSVRLSSVQPRDAGCIEFVTTGVLLRRLMRDQTLEGVSHIMIDEVHERDINTDFLLVLLRELVSKRPELRVILMSATLDAESFSNYFTTGEGARSPPLMSVPAKPRHHVETFHLEDIVGGNVGLSNGEKTRDIRFELQNLAQDLLLMHDQHLQLDLEEAEAEEQASLQLERMSTAEDEGEILTGDSDSETDDDNDSDNQTDVPSVAVPRSRRAVSPRRARLKALRRAVAMRHTPGDKPVQKRRRKADDREVSDITVALVAKTAQLVAELETNAGRKGSILCFLPGWDEIKAAMTILEEYSHEMQNKLIILPLHSTIPREDQQRVFRPAADGMVKVILATNIAESSVTIDDVLAIVDSGLVREMNWDAESAMSTMSTVPTSRASATQRMGRAGRVAPGTCYRLYSRGMLEAMSERSSPEIQRTALEATCLQTCSMTQDGVQNFLSRAMDPPPEETVTYALDRLEKLGAINATNMGETLSPLGHLLSRLPLDPATGKMLIVGCVMQCLDPVLTAAACLSSRDPFFTPPGMRDEARDIRRSFCESSDLMARVRAYDAFIEMTQEKGWSEARVWASDNFLSIAALNTISSLRSQLLNELTRIGLVHGHDLEPRKRRKKVLRHDASVNQNADNETLFSAVWATAVPGNLAARRQLGNFGTLRTKMEDHTGLHPSSVAFHRKPPGVMLPKWFFYNEMVLSSQVFIRNCTAMKPEQIMLFGGNSLNNLHSAGDPLNHVVLDDWVIAESKCYSTIELLSTLRREINAALAIKVMNPRRPLPEATENIIDAVSQTFSILDERDDAQYTDQTASL